jgi:polygalacturonase
MGRQSRREFTSGILGASAGSFTVSQSPRPPAAGSENRVFDVRKYGASGGGSRNDSAAIQNAVEACAQSGGGTVLFPPGRYVTGTIRLRSRVTLHLSQGSVLVGSTKLEDYPITVPAFHSYTDSYTDKSLIYGENLESVAIEGLGSLDGQGASFSGPYKVRPYMVQHYLACDDVRIEGITVRSQVNRNNDGIDIDGCERVRISSCDIRSGDDAIVLKSTSGRMCRDVVVNHCILSSRCNALKLGTESNGGFDNIVINGCSLHDTRLAGIALECVDGGTLQRVVVSDLVMRDVECPIFIRLGDRARPFLEGGARPGVGILRDILVRGILASGAGRMGCAVAGIPGHPVEQVTLSEIRIACGGGGTREQAQRAVPEEASKYPEYSMFGVLPAYGFYCRHAKGLRLSDIGLDPAEPDARPAVVCEEVENLEIRGLRAPAPPPGGTVLDLHGVRGARIEGDPGGR